MIRERIRLDVPFGLHARPCCMIAETMQAFRGRLEIRSLDRAADARSVLELMTLAAGEGAELELVATGEDSGAMLEAVLDLFRRGFGGGAGG